MLETWIIIITALLPSAEPKLQEFISPNCRAKVEEWREHPTTIMARCEARQAPKKETK